MPQPTVHRPSSQTSQPTGATADQSGPRPQRLALTLALTSLMGALAGCQSLPPHASVPAAPSTPLTATTLTEPPHSGRSQADAETGAITGWPACAPACPEINDGVGLPGHMARQAWPPEPGAAATGRAAPDLYHRLRAGFALPALQGVAAERQAQERARYQRMNGHLAAVFGRSRAYLYDIVEAVEREGLPLELALLPAVESAFNVQARSWASADGLWQFIAPTARRFGLQVHHFQDDRRHVREATRGALAYLKTLSQRYQGDMHLALAAYNTGEGNVDKALARARAQGLEGRYDQLRLAQETLDYVPRLMALAELVAEAVDGSGPSAKGWPALANAPYFVGVPIARDIDVQLAAQWAGLSLEAFKALNPSHKRPVIVAAANAEVLVPVEREASFIAAMQRHSGPRASWTAVTLPRRMAPEALAQQFGGSAEQLRAVNNIPRLHLVSAGSTVLVPRGQAAPDIPAEAAASAHFATLPALQTIQLPHKKRDSWPQWAQRAGVSPRQLRSWNPRPLAPTRHQVRLQVPIDVAERLAAQPTAAMTSTTPTQRVAAAATPAAGLRNKAQGSASKQRTATLPAARPTAKVQAHVSKRPARAQAKPVEQDKKTGRGGRWA